MNPFGIPVSLTLAAVLTGCGATATPSHYALADSPPPASAALDLAAPITSWDEAIPLGNGLMGGLLWGEGATLRLSLDRGDLWDERPHGDPDWWTKLNYPTGAKLIAENRHAEVNRAWDAPYNGVTPTKLPAGRLEIDLPKATRLTRFALDARRAEGVVSMASGPEIRALFSAVDPVALLSIPGVTPEAIRLIPAGEKARKAGDAGPSSGGAVAKLGYPPATHGADDHARWYVQQGDAGFRYCVCVATRRAGDATLVAIAVTATTDAPDVLALARERCGKALDAGYAATAARHAARWADFADRSAVSLPDAAPEIVRQYNTTQYYYGAASRRGAPPMPLQGVWTADNGGLPPWKGDYHNDLNTQMTYIAYPAAGHFDEGACYLDYLWDRRDRFREFTKAFYGTDGATCPGVMSLSGRPLGGWGQYSLSPTMGAWSAHLFYLHWRYTQDDAFLRGRAYPWCADVGECLLGLLKPDAAGLLKLPLSSSPEIHDNSARAWLKPNSGYDQACMRQLFLCLREMALGLGRPADAARWADAAQRLGDLPVAPNGELLIAQGEPLKGSHRHLSHLIGIHPFNLVNIDDGATGAARVRASLDAWEKTGSRAWVGYSFAWTACAHARAGDGESALKRLDQFCKHFVSRNGFHLNGDQTKSGLSGFTYRPFTLEGNFIAAQAVHEMLLQSWSPTPGEPDTEVIRIFPAMPKAWPRAAYRDLRAEGGHKVSAIREAGMTTRFRIIAGRDGVVRIRDNFGGRTPAWSRDGLSKVGANYEITLRRGDTLEATFPQTHGGGHEATRSR